ncbi:hypothetical protein ACIQI7_12620 [Kitasatospora sp. NPDC092039]
MDQTLKDHEDRVRALERWRYGIVASGLARRHRTDRRGCTP